MTRRFPLAVLLAVREQKETAEARVLAQLNGQVSQLTQILTRLNDELCQQAETRSSVVAMLSLAADHVAFQSRRQELYKAQAEIQNQVHALQEKLHLQQRTYVMARCDRETLTELREQHKKEWESHENVRDQKIVADLFNARRSTR